MIRLDVQLDHLAFQSLALRHETRVDKPTKVALQNTKAVLWYENDVVLAVPNYMG